MTKCPICNSPVEEIEHGAFDGKTFRCAKHGEFQVADKVLKTPGLMNAGEAKWEGALKVAAEKAVEGQRPRILSYDFS